MSKAVTLIGKRLPLVGSAADQRLAPVALGHPVLERLPCKFELVDHLAFDQRQSASLAPCLEQRRVVCHVQFPMQLEIPSAVHLFAENRKLQQLVRNAHVHSGLELHHRMRCRREAFDQIDIQPQRDFTRKAIEVGHVVPHERGRESRGPERACSRRCQKVVGRRAGIAFTNAQQTRHRGLLEGQHDELETTVYSFKDRLAILEA